MAKFDDRTIRNFEKYLELQKSGEMNMVSAGVREKLGISKEEHVFIMENYSDIKNEYESLKVVDEVLEDAKVRSNGKAGKDKGLEDKAVEPVKGQQ